MWGSIHTPAGAATGVALSPMTQQPPHSARPAQDPSDGPESHPASASPPPGWAPAPLSGEALSSGGGRKGQPPPAAPLGSPSMRSVKIDEFVPPRSKVPLLVTLIALLAAALIFFGTTMRPALPGPTATSPAPSATDTLPGLPFLTPDDRFSGRWEIVEHRWTDAGLEVEIRIMVDHGPVSYSFVAFENTGVEATDPDPGSQPPRFSGRPIDSGEEETGWLFFPLTRGPATVILADEGRYQMSALSVPG